MALRIKKYKKAIAGFLNIEPERVFLFWKGRVALYAILKSLGIKHGDEIVLPGFTCVVVPNVIKYLDAIPVYVDINADTFNADFESIKGAVTANTKVIIVQNTFGLSSDVDKIAQWSLKRRIHTIEDCTHGFGGTFNGKPNGSFCDAAFYSTQWNKPYSTGLGGFAVINNERLLSLVEKEVINLRSPSFVDELSLLLLNVAHCIILHPQTYWFVRDLYRIMSKNGLVTGSSDKTELTSTEMPGDYYKGTSSIQAWLGSLRIRSIDKKLDKRREYALKYTKFLADHRKNHVSEQLFINHSFLKYPLIVKDRDSFQKKALKKRIPLGDWFVSPIHPIVCNFDNWCITLENIPVADKLSRQIVNLPTEDADVDKVLKFLNEEIELIV